MFIVIHSYKFFIHIIQLRFYDSLTYKVGIGSDKSSPLRDEVTSWWLWYIKKQLLKASLCLSATLNPQLAHKKAICSTQMAFSRYDLELRLFRQFQFFSTRIDVLPRLTKIFFFGQKCQIKIFYCIFLNTIVIYSNTLLSRYSALDIGKQCNSNFCPQRAQTVQYNDVHILYFFPDFRQLVSL